MLNLGIRLIALACALCALQFGFAPALAQTADESYFAVARIDPQNTEMTQKRDVVSLRLGLSQGIPFRIFTLAEPERLVMDFREVDWTGLPPDFAEKTTAVAELRVGIFRPGWSRMVLDLAEPMRVVSVEMQQNAQSGTSTLVAKFEITDAQNFKDLAGAPPNALWPARALSKQAGPKPKRLRLAIDPGHGGIDPGAVRAGVTEKSIALGFGRELRAALENHPVFDVFMTRDTDEFLSLRERVLSARGAQADLFLSLHANTVTVGDATGATVYLLSDEASDREAAALAEKENRADIMAGVALEGEEDAVARILVDLAQARTNMRSQNFGHLLVQSLRDHVDVIRSRPLRSAGFEVLKAPEIPSILLELGFLSNTKDRRNMQSAEWRAKAIKGVIAALDRWIHQDAEQRALNLQ